MKASIITLGCKVNEYESQSMLNQLLSVGYEITEGYEIADLYIVNSCAVTNMAERKSRQVLTKLKKLNPDAKIVVCGCAAQNDPAQFLKDKNVIALTGNFGKHDIMKIIGDSNKVLPDLVHHEYISFVRPIVTRTRQFIKIQDGCDYFCSYCLIPYIRGRSRSRQLDDIISEIQNTKTNEIVLTGINMTDYRIKGKFALKELIKEVDKLGKRFRLSSIECMALDDEMIDFLSDCKNFCPHFHISLQSACDDTLKRMNRRYKVEQYIEICDKIKNKFKSVCISTDIIVGFKGETDKEFDETYNNLKRINFSFMHIFPYSDRTGTVASKLSGEIGKEIVKERIRRLEKLNKEFKINFFKNNEDTIHQVLIEECSEGYSLGYTGNYIYTYIPAELEVGKIVTVKLQKTYINGMMAEQYGGEK